MKTIATNASAPSIEAPAGGEEMGQPQKKPAADREIVKFRLYVADHSPNSKLARTNLSAICALHMPDRHDIEILDIFCEAERALEDGVTMTPTLVKFAPLPVRKVVGALRHAELVMVELGLAVTA